MKNAHERIPLGKYFIVMIKVIHPLTSKSTLPAKWKYVGEGKVCSYYKLAT